MIPAGNLTGSITLYRRMTRMASSWLVSSRTGASTKGKLPNFGAAFLVAFALVGLLTGLLAKSKGETAVNDESKTAATVSALLHE